MRSASAARVAVFLLLPVLAGCSSSTSTSTSMKSSPEPAVPVGGAASDIAALNGRWEGEYSSPDTGRTGSIVFEFKGATGAGDVLMMPKKSADAAGSMPQVLTIRFVSAEGGDLSGQLAPYVDPDCSCEVTTTFKGRREKDIVRGTFTTARTAEPDKKANGTWSVKRSNRPSEKPS